METRAEKNSVYLYITTVLKFWKRYIKKKSNINNLSKTPTLKNSVNLLIIENYAELMSRNAMFQCFALRKGEGNSK